MLFVFSFYKFKLKYEDFFSVIYPDFVVNALVFVELTEFCLKHTNASEKFLRVSLCRGINKVAE